jgi:hypothetical protein
MMNNCLTWYAYLVWILLWMVLQHATFVLTR